MLGYVVQRVVELFNRQRKAVNGRRILLFGLACKNTGGAHESLAVRVAEFLLPMRADASAVAPHAEDDLVLASVPVINLEPGEVPIVGAIAPQTAHDYFHHGPLDTAPSVPTMRGCASSDCVDQL